MPPEYSSTNIQFTLHNSDSIVKGNIYRQKALFDEVVSVLHYYSKEKLQELILPEPSQAAFVLDESTLTCIKEISRKKLAETLIELGNMVRQISALTNRPMDEALTALVKSLFCVVFEYDLIKNSESIQSKYKKAAGTLIKFETTVRFDGTRHIKTINFHNFSLITDWLDDLSKDVLEDIYSERAKKDTPDDYDFSDDEYDFTYGGHGMIFIMRDKRPDLQEDALWKAGHFPPHELVKQLNVGSTPSSYESFEGIIPYFLAKATLEISSIVFHQMQSVNEAQTLHCRFVCECFRYLYKVKKGILPIKKLDMPEFGYALFTLYKPYRTIQENYPSDGRTRQFSFESLAATLSEMIDEMIESSLSHTDIKYNESDLVVDDEYDFT